MNGNGSSLPYLKVLPVIFNILYMFTSSFYDCDSRGNHYGIILEIPVAESSALKMRNFSRFHIYMGDTTAF